MASPWRERALAATAGMLLAGGVVVAVELTVGSPICLLTGPTYLDFARVDLERARSGVRAAAADGLRGAYLARPVLDEETVRSFMPLRGERRVHDPHCYFVYRPGLGETQRFPEHPRGRWERRVNSLGLRDSQEWDPEAGLHVVVTGDSHVDGVCPEEETLPARLARALPGDRGRVQVLNAAHGAYGFLHYVGVLERFLALDLRPDLLVVVVYGGNDFAGSLYEASLVQMAAGPRLPPRWLRRREELLARWPSEMGQVGSSVLLFEALPEAVEPAAAVAELAALELRDLCREHGVGLLVAYLPSPLEVPGAGTEELARVLRRIGGADPAARTAGRLADGLLAALERGGIAAVDLRPGFRTAPEGLYWRSDLHLATGGQARAAELLLPAVREALGLDG